MKTVTLTKLAEAVRLTNVTPEINTDDVKISLTEINRPALQLTGYYEHFEAERVQIIGYVEYSYLVNHLTREEKVKAYEEFVSKKIPCVIFTTQVLPDEDMLELAHKYQVPTFTTDRTTSDCMSEIIRWLSIQLAPYISIHGVLVDV